MFISTHVFRKKLSFNNRFELNTNRLIQMQAKEQIIALPEHYKPVTYIYQQINKF